MPETSENGTKMFLDLPTLEQQEFIRKECHEDINTRDKDLEHIKEWLFKQPHLPDTWEEVGLLNFLRGCNFSLERTKKKLDTYFTVRAALPEFFADRDIMRPELIATREHGQGPTLPAFTPEGRRVTILRGYDTSMDDLNMIYILKMAFMFGDLRLKTDKYGVAGDVCILDANALTTQLFIKCADPVVVKKILFIMQNAYPVKIKEVHIVNASSAIDMVINWVMRFVKEKLRKRIHVHTEMETLYDFFPREILPEEYGGTAGKIADITDGWLKMLEDNLPWFKEQENVKADESKRPGKPTNYEDLFGLDGSFRQLNVD